MPERPADDLQDRIARIAISLVTEPGNRSVWAMVQADGAAAALERLMHGDIRDSAVRASARTKVAGGDDPRKRAEAVLKRSERLGVRLVVPSDDEWPDRVDDLAELELDPRGRVVRNVRPPLCLWVRGQSELREMLQQSVAVVGARAATSYGTHIATELAFGLAAQVFVRTCSGATGRTSFGTTA